MSTLQPPKGNPQRQEVERRLWKYFEKLSFESRREMFEELSFSYSALMSLLRQKVADEEGLPNSEQIAVRLANVRAHTKAPRMKKEGRQFLHRHYNEAMKLREAGASYREIAEYLKLYRRFSIDPKYLRGLMLSIK